MDNLSNITSSQLKLVQFGWVIQDMENAKTLFQNLLNTNNFSQPMTTKLNQFQATYYGQPSNGINLVSMAYVNGMFLELIQPISGKSIFNDFLETNPLVGIHHIAYSTSLTNLDNVISNFEANDFPIISSFDTPIAKIVFFDTRKDIGLFTEIMGITEEGEIAIQQMKSGIYN